MADLLIVDADRDALVASGLLLATLEGTVTYRVVSSLPEAARLLHDARKAYTRITLCGIPPADTGSLRSALTVLQARGTRVRWFDSHDLHWTTEVRGHLDYLDVEAHLPDPHRPETERTAGLVLAYLLDSGHPGAVDREAELRPLVSAARSSDLGGPDWVALADCAVHDHRLIANRALRSAALRVWDADSPLTDLEHRLIALQRSREGRVERFLESLAGTVPFGERLLSIDAGIHPELRYLRPRLYAEPARRMTGSEYAQVLVGRNWAFACRDPYGAGLDLPIAYLERLYDLDVSVSGYPYRATVRVESGADLRERIMKVLEDALEDERKGRIRPGVLAAPDEDIDW